MNIFEVYMVTVLLILTIAFCYSVMFGNHEEETFMDRYMKMLRKTIFLPYQKIWKGIKWLKSLKRFKEEQLMIFKDDLVRFYPDRKKYCRYFTIAQDMEIVEYSLINEKFRIYHYEGEIRKSRGKDGFIKLCVNLDQDTESLKKSLTAENKFNL